MGKFSLQKACGVDTRIKAPAQKTRAALQSLPLRSPVRSLKTQPPLVRTADIIVYKRDKAAPRIYKTTLKQSAKKQKKLFGSPSAPPGGEQKSRNKSILTLLMKGASAKDNLETEGQLQRKPRERIGAATVYVKDVMRECSKHLKNQCLWIAPPLPAKAAAAINEQRKSNGEQLLDADELLNLYTRPSIFVWDPMALLPGLSLSCPSCGLPATRCDWCPSRRIQRLHGNSVYVTARYGCYACGRRSGPKKADTRTMKRFLADAPEVLASLPWAIRSQWQFTNTGRSLCDAPVTDLIRAMATKTSWSAIANAINEMTSAAWAREIRMPYVRLCETMKIAALHQKSCCPVELWVTDKCVKNMYMKDFALRHEGVVALVAGSIIPPLSFAPCNAELLRP